MGLNMSARGYCILSSLLLFSGCADKEFNVDKAAERGEVNNIHGNITNLDRFNQFLIDVETHIDSKLRITQMTDEGDPIYYDLAYKKDKITYSFDNSEDKFGKKNVMSTECNGLASVKVERGISYTLEGCKSSQVGQTFSFVVPDKT
ncbi:hypothetical protein A8709_17350 [Paenibacillus pectinilyticus]|uniref:DUF4362 domain-containing protein n=1 Tax=Paenibacillus pectinilyticus TaxID=512399 RepID=A0A1C0ZZ44_9BACL|nr:DUF4362 domain-containing protein [Paenibacillus pectinilyticus]OCT13380.1 hypothetical protein A8709_17350 [Paenibacillus pectinilyticus]